MSSIYTIGHSTRTSPEFLELLQSVEIRALVDVRRYPGSKRHPQFNREALAETLAAADVDYHHAPDLGGRREAAEDSANSFWRNASFRAYADYMATQEFRDALQRVEALAQRQRVAIMCAEAVPWRCHRQLIADALVARGHEVHHILSLARADTHELSAGAVRGAQGNLTYPGTTGIQPTLFESREA
jgi:uncharacterized protein (DUF488 family)